MRWGAEALWEQVSPRLPGFTVEILPEIDSTNTELMRRARAGQTEPVLLVAERQTAGRGRLGRAWQGAPGDSLMFSLGLPLSMADWSGLSLAVGVAVAESLHPRVGLKWPNDLWVSDASGDRKLGGILIESALMGAATGPRQAVIGIGINLAPRPAEGLSTPPAALADLWPEGDAPAALARIVLPLVAMLQDFEAQGFAPVRPRFAARDVLAGRAVRLTDGTEGRAAGVTDNGALLVHTASGMKTVTSAEVSVRPVDPPGPGV
jgi:BirA family biotin operon repressor/biotin-[acetyl-CoA-carboxylase] ligase